MPIDFSYMVFAVLLFVIGLTMASFGSPNRAAVMNSLPARHRGVGLGDEHDLPELRAGAVDRAVLHADDRRVLGALPASLEPRPGRATGCPRRPPHRVSHLPPVSTLFAAFLGYNPIQHLVGPHVLAGA